MSALLLYRIAIDIFFFLSVHNFVRAKCTRLNPPNEPFVCFATGAGGRKYFRTKIIFIANRTPLSLSSGKLAGKLPFNSNDSQEFYGEKRQRKNIGNKKKELTRIRPIHVSRSSGRRTGRVPRTFSTKTRSSEMCTALLSIFRSFQAALGLGSESECVLVENFRRWSMEKEKRPFVLVYAKSIDFSLL